MVLRARLLVIAMAFFLFGCSDEVRETVPEVFSPDTGIAAYVAGSAVEFPKVMFPDGKISVNDKCPSTMRALTKDQRAIYVNGQPFGFC